MNFREYYEKEELMEFSDASKEGVVGKASTAIGNLAGAIYKGISGYFKKAWDATPIAQTLNDMKEKGDKAIEVAKYIYPYDNEKYAQLQKEGKLKDTKAIASFFTQKVMDEDANYPIGLGIVYRTYDAVSTSVRELPKMKGKKFKLSMQTLLESAKEEKIKFPKYKNAEEYRSAFEKEKKQGSQWARWMTTATSFSSWKNLYDNTETENAESFVGQVNDSQISSYSIKTIQEKIDDLESRDIEVNIKTLEDAFGKELSEVMEDIMTKIKAGNETYVDSKNLDVDENVLKNFLNSTLIKKIMNSKNTLMLANIYSTTSALITKNNITSMSIATIFSSLPSFCQLFSSVKNFDPKLAKKGSETEQRKIIEHYFSMNGDGIQKTIKIKPEYITKPPQKLYDTLVTGKE